MEYKLKTPITKVDGEKIEVVEVKESFTGRDVRAIGNSDGQGSAVIALVSCAIGVTTNTVLNMNSRDVNAIRQIAEPFLADGEG